MMKQSVLLALLLGLLSACQPSVEDILKENDYAKSFDYVWNTLDANYPYFDYVLPRRMLSGVITLISTARSNFRL